ncbi:hypothetical protein A9Q79_01370 [Methylophaga sp. 42_25_T18]|nr:hypothetical protein A9Q79_01370 [Methylophaga sp. 42_25_T18]OUR86332.1 hypothetical protein A9Q92_05945 [Methylophaga sp. 42_8_T64]
MSTLHEIVIKLSTTKAILLIVGSLAFVGVGVYLTSIDPIQIEEHRRFNNPLFVYGIGWASILIFGLSCLYHIRKLFDKKPGLTFNSTGIIDNSSGIAAGLIPWNDIKGFNIYEVNKQKMLVISLNNPNKYIEMGNLFKRALNRANYKMCGSPLSITPNSLQINFDELIEITNKYFNEYAKQT